LQATASLSSALGKVWDLSFTVSLKSCTKDITNILEELDKINGRVQIMEQNRARLQEKPNARKQRQLEAEAEEFRAEKAPVLEEEQEILGSVELQPKYRTEEQAALER